MAKGDGIFKEPRETTGRKAIGALIVRLLLLEPGTDPNRPEMGVELVSKNIDLSGIENNIDDGMN